MATKKLKKKVQRKPTPRKAENPVIDSARDVWLAGLGALSMAQQGSGKMFEQGNKLFDKLVKEGAKLEKQTREDVEGAFEDLRGEFDTRVRDFRGDIESRVKDFRSEFESRAKDIRNEVESRLGTRKRAESVRGQAEKLRGQANQNWDKLENFFEARVARVLSRLGIPSRDDIDGLNKRVQQLSREMAELKRAKKAKPARKATAKKATRKKAAVKPAAPKAQESSKAA